jgi:peptidylprolyl isomerase
LFGESERRDEWQRLPRPVQRPRPCSKVMRHDGPDRSSTGDRNPIMAPNAGDTVLVHYRGTLEDGSEFDSSEGSDPLRFTIGAGEVIQGFEDAVAALEIGQTTTVTLAAEDAYGPRYDDAVQTVDAADFAEGQEPFVGGMVSIVSPDGQHLAAEITSVVGTEVVLDFNHPLAGKALTFELTLVEVIPA